jgi:hypothetical protein
MLTSSVVDRGFEPRLGQTKDYKIGIVSPSVLVSEWLLINANSAILQLYHGEEQVNFQWDDDEVRFVLDQHADFL